MVINLKKQKYWFAIIAIIAILIFIWICFFYNAPKSSSVDREKGELVISAIPSTVSRLQTDANAFMEEHSNVKVVVHEYEENIYKKQAPELFISDEKPDIAWYWQERWYHQIVDSGALVPLDDLYEKEGWNEVIPESTLRRYTEPDGHKYSVNTNISWTPIIYYNKQIFESLGIDKPTTFDELFTIGEILKKNGYIPMAASLGENHTVGHIFDALLQRNLSESQFKKLLDRSRIYPDITYEHPDVVEVWKVMREMSINLIPSEMVNLNEDEARALFVQGEAAMYSSISVYTGILENDIPENMGIDYFYYPQLNAKVQPKVQLYAGDALMVISGTGKEELAKEFLAFVMKHERQKEHVQQRNYVSSRTDIKMEDGSLLSRMYKEMNEIGTTPLWDDDIPGPFANKSFDIHRKVLTGEITPKKAGQKMQEAFLKGIEENN